MTTTARPVRYVDVTETARLVRAALKREFPTVRFSVRSDRYAGGSSIDVRWTDGPRAAPVDAIIKRYEGANFDGMIDLKYHMTHYLRPDGSVMLRHNPGTAGSRGTDPGDDNRMLEPVLPADAEPVQFSADFIFSHREISNRADLIEAALAMIRARCTLEANGRQFGNQWIDNLASAMAYQIDFLKGETLDHAFQRVVMHRRDEDLAA